MRGEKEQVLAVNLDGGGDEVYEAMVAQTLGVNLTSKAAATPWLATTVRLAWRVKLMVSAAVDARIRLRQRAEQDAVAVFAKNLKDLLLAAPAGTRTTLGLDPGFRTGVKVAVVDATGKVVDTCAIFPHQPQKQWDVAKATLAALVARHGVQLIAIGNGTASRETDALATELIAEIQKAGADCTREGHGERGGRVGVLGIRVRGARTARASTSRIRGAVSIARRLQDPLAELVKIEPKSIGVGQYQHDVTPGTLARSLDAVVEDAVNAVGVDLNTASVPLLARVSGRHGVVGRGHRRPPREDRAGSASRKALLDVPRLGPKAFEQCAGFLRINGGDDPLDASGVHPEAYPVVRRILDRSGVTLAELIGDERSLRSLRPADFADDRFGVPDGDRHPRRTREAGTRSAARVLDGHVRRRRGEGGRPEGGHGPGGRGDQRGCLRGVRRRRRASGRAGARLRDVRPLRLRPTRGGAVRAGGPGEGPRGRRGPPADRADPAARTTTRSAARASAPIAERPRLAATPIRARPERPNPNRDKNSGATRVEPVRGVDGSGIAGRRVRALTTARLSPTRRSGRSTRAGA